MIISRVLNNPKIDKRTLLQKFISRIEMESDLNNAGINSEISTIKEFINKEHDDGDSSNHQPAADHQLKQMVGKHASSHQAKDAHDTNK